VTSSAPAGLYQDPLNPNAVRYWDGQQWTQQPYVPPTFVPLPVPTDRLDTRGARQYVGFIRAVILGFRQYAKFAGRASRSEYWWWTLATVLGLIGALALPLTDGIYYSVRGRENCEAHYGGINTVCTPHAVFWAATAVSIACGLLLIAMILPSLTLAVRRLHDSGLSGYLTLLFVPIPIAGLGVIGGCVVLVMCARPTSRQANKYGYPPTKGKPRRHRGTTANTNTGE
jgi:uncharacterized membrane protein YhaH (DUF805 family)